MQCQGLGRNACRDSQHSTSPSPPLPARCRGFLGTLVLVLHQCTSAVSESKESEDTRIKMPEVGRLKMMPAPGSVGHQATDRLDSAEYWPRDCQLYPALRTQVLTRDCQLYLALRTQVLTRDCQLYLALRTQVLTQGLPALSRSEDPSIDQRLPALSQVLHRLLKYYNWECIAPAMTEQFQKT